MKSIVDTSVLISLARINSLELLRNLRMKAALPNEVYTEAVVRGQEKGFADAVVIRTFIEGYDKIDVINVNPGDIKALRERLKKFLTAGDEAVLSLAIKERASELVTDDDGLAKIALAIGLSVRATPDLLLEGFKKSILNNAKFENLVRGLVIENRISSAIGELYIMEARKYVEG